MADGVEVNLTGLDSVLGNWMPSHRSLAINPVGAALRKAANVITGQSAQ